MVLLQLLILCLDSHFICDGLDTVMLEPSEGSDALTVIVTVHGAAEVLFS